MVEAMAGSRPCRAAAGRPNWPRAAAATWLPPWRLHTSHESPAPALTIDSSGPAAVQHSNVERGHEKERPPDLQRLPWRLLHSWKRRRRHGGVQQPH